jgi:uncharacterized membrane protein
MSEISIDNNGWIDPTCPHCECVMQFNYTNWHKSGTHVFQYPDFNMYCLRCHYAVHIKPATVDAKTTEVTNYDIQVYNKSNMEASE